MAACGKPALKKPVFSGHPDCRLYLEPGAKADTINVALLNPVRPDRAPRPQNTSEQLLFGHIYETLITVDCRGEVRAALAESWLPRERGRRWTFTLRENAQFWDGLPVTAFEVAASWRSRTAEFLNLETEIDSFTADNDRELSVYFKQPLRRVPRLLAEPVFAVAKPDYYTVWPLGSGPFRTLSRRYSYDLESQRRVLIQTAADPEGPVVRFIETTNYDVRDLLGERIDMLVTGDPAVIEYAAGRSRLETTALPWNRMYLLLATSRVMTLRRGGRLGEVPLELLTGLARDAVRSDARGAVPPDWWYRQGGCAGRPAGAAWQLPDLSGASGLNGPRRILYDSDDPVARDLAERIVALAAAGPDISSDSAALAEAVPGLISGSAGLAADGISSDELLSNLRSGEDYAYIVSVSRQPYDACYEIRRLLSRAPWLFSPDHDLTAALVPLVDTRLHVIRNAGKVDLIIDWSGRLMLTNELYQQ
jgi:hypothetical protein